MIRVRYRIDKTDCLLSVEGHAEYAEKGKDIVCAGVSAICMSLYRALDVSQTALQVMQDDGVLHLRAFDHGSDVRAMYSMAVLGLNHIAGIYSDHVRVEKI